MGKKVIVYPSRRMGKTQFRKDAWIKETQMFQRIAGQPESTYDNLSIDYDKHLGKSTQRKASLITMV